MIDLKFSKLKAILFLTGCESLKKLDLTVNFIGELTSIESLQGLINLRELLEFFLYKLSLFLFVSYCNEVNFLKGIKCTNYITSTSLMYLFLLFK